MDKSSSESRVDSSRKQPNSEGSRAKKLKALDAKLDKLDATLKRLDVEFDECERQIVYTMKSREILIDRMYILIKTLEKTIVHYEYAENAREKLDERREALSLKLRDKNLDERREQELQETIEHLTEVQDDLGKTERDVRLSHEKCVRYEAELNVLTIANEAVHQRLCENFLTIETSRQEVLVKCGKLLLDRRAMEKSNKD